MTSRLLAMVRVMAMAMAVSTAGSAWADDFVLVRNASNPIDVLQPNDVKDVYTGKRKQWKNGGEVRVVLTGEDSPELIWLASTFFGVNTRALMSKIRQEVFKGEMNKPISSLKGQDTIEKIAANEGAIGVVSAATAKSLPSSVVAMQVAR